VYANETSIDNYKEARARLELSGAEPMALANVDEKLGGVLAAVDRYDEALEVLERPAEVYREARDLESVARVTALIGWTHCWRGTPQEGISRIQPVLELVTWTGPSQGLASLHLALSYLHFGSGKYEASLEAAERAAELARAVGDGLTLAGAEMRRGTAMTLVSQIEEGVRVLESSVPLLETAGDLNALAIAFNNLATNLQAGGDLKRALERSRQALDIHERIGNTASIGFVDLNLGEINTYLGEWEEAEGSFERGTSALKSVGASWFAAFAPLHRGHLRVRQGRWDEARSELSEAIALAEPIGELQVLQIGNWLLAEVEIREGRPEAARSRLEPLLDKHGPYLIALLTNLAWARLVMGDPDGAEETVNRARAITDERHQRLWVPGILLVRGMILTWQERWEEAHHAFEEAISIARDMPFPYVEGRALGEQGLTFSLQGSTQQAEARLGAALSIFQKLGAQKDVEWAEEELKALGQAAEPAR
jgi:tetratricopeptide (TPR) repeat protein